MKINKWKIVWKYFTGGKEAVLDYALDVANDFINNLSTENRKMAFVCFEKGVVILKSLKELEPIVPQKWQEAYDSTMGAFETVISALYDLKISQEELAEITAKFREAYNDWYTPDEVDEKEEKGEKE